VQLIVQLIVHLKNLRLLKKSRGCYLRVDSGSGVEYPDQVFSLLFLTSLEPSGRVDFVRSTEHPGKLISFPLLSPLSFNEGLVSPN
jgi:hypothetical protein